MATIITALLSLLNAINNALGVISGIEAIIKWLQKRQGNQPALRRKPLDEELHRKYPKTDFLIANDKQTFNRLVAQELIKVIDERMASLQPKSALGSDEVSVGIVCGPMALRLAEWIKKSKRFEKGKYSRLIFVAMNKAGEKDSYYYAANYLVTLFANVFTDSGSIAYTSNRYDQEDIRSHRMNIDILLCSVGSSQAGEKTYLEDPWLKNISKGSMGKAALKESCVGDFCLTPIDADGKLAANPDMENLICEELDPFPRWIVQEPNKTPQYLLLRYLKQFKQADETPYVIFPVKTSATKPVQKNDTSKIIYPITGKEITTRAVLRSGVANVCVLDAILAKNLVNAVGGFLIRHISRKPEDHNPFRKAKAYDLIRKTERDIAIIDPWYRLDSLPCDFDKNLHPPAKPTETIPSIIFCEMSDEDENFDWAEGVGVFKFHRYGIPYAFFVDKEVRKPGMWSLMSGLQGARYVNKIEAEEPLSVWDIGCGSGVIGILMDKLSNGKISNILFSDIEESAIECTKRNVSNLGLAYKARYKKANLFHAAEPNEKFHMIALNPPFAPMAGITNVGVTIDSGGDTGRDLAVRFCQDVYDYLHVGGWALLVIPDYIDDGHLQQILEDRFGPKNIVVHNRFVLYPYETKKDVPCSFEVEHKEEIEKNCNYSFENCFLGDKQFLSFRMRHYLAKRVA
jgi:hypothetical protein